MQVHHREGPVRKGVQRPCQRLTLTVILFSEYTTHTTF